MENVKVNIKKPMYGTHVYIRDVFVEEAIRKGVNLEITIPAGVGIVDPIAWKNRGDIMCKVFKDPNNPMVLYGGNVPIPEVLGKGKKKITTTKVTTIVIEESQTKLL